MDRGYRILVTGASSGFGKLTAETLARGGHRVFAGMRDPAERNAKARAELLDKSGSIDVVDLDITDDAKVAGALKHIESAAGGLDVVVNNAGIAAMGLTEAFTADQARALFDVNVVGMLRVNRAALPLLRQSPAGLIIHLSSTLGRYVMPFLGLYTASKFAVEALAEAYRYELAPLGIESVIVQPGTFPTPMLGNLEKPADPERNAAYGSQNDIIAGMAKGLAAMAESPNAPNPQDVADAILALVNMPAGSRPARTLVDRQGVGPAVEGLNRNAADVQAQIFGAMGLSHLLQVARRG